MLPAHQVKGELAIPVHTYRHRRATITAGKGWGICRFTHTSQACRARPRTTRHARICNGAPVLNEARTQENSLRGHRSHNRGGSDVTSGCWSLPVRVAQTSVQARAPKVLSRPLLSQPWAQG